MNNLSASQMIIYMIGACVLLLIMVMFARQTKFVLKCTLRCGLSLLLIAAVNSVLSTSAVGINLFTALFTAMLGLPGVATLYALGLFL